MKTTLVRLAYMILTALQISEEFALAKAEELCEGPDHYLSYPFTSVDFPPLGSVALHDQFIGTITAFVTFTIIDGVRLLNPAHKFHKEEIIIPKHPNTHYLGVSLTTPTGGTIPTLPAGLKVNIFNQFDDITLTATDFVDTNPDTVAVEPRLELLVPSLKAACPEGECTPACGDDCFPEGDHYLCYELNLREPSCLAANARFEDQFLKNRIVEDLIPVRLCNPVDKTFNGVTTIAHHDDSNHLLCYTIPDKRIPPHFVQMLNQLGEQSGVVRINSDVCVPSTKIDLTPPVPPVPVCADATVPMCIGTCATGTGTCLDVNGTCTCVTAQTPCSVDTGTCEGSCPNGTTCTIINAVCQCLPSLRAFMTSTTYTGDLVGAANALTPPTSLTVDFNCSADSYTTGGVTFATNPTTCGVAAADCLCRERAASANLLCGGGGFGCWKAWISDSTAGSAPASRFNMALSSSTIPIDEVDTTGAPDPSAPIARGGWADLVVCGDNQPGDIEAGPPPVCLDDPSLETSPCGIPPHTTWVDEVGIRNTSGGLKDLWSNVLDSGQSVFLNPHDTCDDWSAIADPSGIAGALGDPSQRQPNAVDTCGSIPITVGWTNAGTGICPATHHLYCFEDP